MSLEKNLLPDQKMPKAKSTVYWELIACNKESFNGLELVKNFTENSIKQLYKAIDLVYKLVSDVDQIINCFFAVSMRNAYRVVSNKTKDSVSITTADRCYGCNEFFIEKKSLEQHMNVCGHFPRIVY